MELRTRGWGSIPSASSARAFSGIRGRKYDVPILNRISVQEYVRYMSASEPGYLLGYTWASLPRVKWSRRIRLARRLVIRVVTRT